ncbi:nucleo TPR isoform X1 [Brachionus plicatilis]|uniref:Nucleo TPR isoform X1 n=1 Tax=Brachionus plicatilis TaxID=10195 RepID=A0A3M7T8K6_BRAPC|nr:nucleo TPR isoform X1 [Brachionus plicatilis]
MDDNLQLLNPFDENTQNLDDPIAVTSPSGFLNVNTDDPNPTSDYKRVFHTIFELTDDELAKIEDHLKDKIQSHGENFLQKYDNLQANYEKFKIECEQRFIELESEYTECQNKLSFESKNAHLYQTKSTENEDKVVTLTKQNKLLENEKETLASNQQRLNTVNQNLEAEKRDLLSLLDKKIKENDRLNEEWKSINVKLSDSESKICEITAQLEEIRGRESTIGFKERQFQADKERLLNEIDWLNQQLKDKSMQLLESKGNSNQKIYDLESKIEDYSAENRKNKNLMDALQNANQSMETQIDELTKKLQEIREKDIKLKLEFNEEAMQRDKLIDMYKEENSNCKIRLEDAANAIKELNQMISEAKEEYSKLADEKNFNETSYEAKIKEKDEMIYKLEQELKNANELLSIAKRKGATVLSESDIEQLSPAAAVASKLLKSGMTLTQIYSEYVNLTETLQNEKKENERLKSYITEVIHEIEEKAPLLRRQKEEYEDSLKTISNLTAQLENAYMDYEVLKSKSEDSIKKYNSLSFENVRLKQDLGEMSRQVTVLLSEVEQLRSKLTSRGTRSENPDSTLANLFADPNESNFEVSSSSETRIQGASLFRNIEELQKQNMELKRLLNEITDKKQSEEKIELELRTKEFGEKLGIAMRQLEEFKTQREKQEQVLDEIRKQRDTYKHLLMQQQPQSVTRLPSEFFTSTPGADRTRSETSEQLELSIDQEQVDFKKKYDEASTALARLQSKFDNHQKQMVQTNNSLSEQVDELRTKNSELGMKAALSDSKLEGTLEKCKSLTTNIEKLRKELESYKERLSKSNELIIKHEQSIHLTTVELNRCKEKIDELDTKLHSTSVEKDMLKSNYERLTKEHELLIRENNSRTSILANLEIIRNSCERNERETKQMLNQKIELLERELTIQQKQSEHCKEQHDVLIKSWQNQFEQLSQQRNAEVHNADKLKSDYNELKEKFYQLQTRYNEAEAKLHSNELLVQISRNSKPSSAISRLTHLEEETKELQMKLSLSEKEIVSLKIQLEDSKEHAKQYKNISDTMEKTMKEESEARAKSQQIYEQKISDLNSRMADLGARYDETVGLKSQLENAYERDKKEFEEKVGLLEKEKKSLTSNVELLEKKVENLEQILDERSLARDDFAAKLTVSEEQVKSLSERMQILEKESSGFDNQMSEMRQNLQSRDSELEGERKLRLDQAEAFKSSENVLNSEISKLKKEIENLIEQNNKIQVEFSKVGQDFVTLQKQDFGTMLKTDEQSASNLLEINRYLRMQKDNLEENCEKLKIDNEVCQKRVQNMESELEFYKKQCYEKETKTQTEQNQTNMDNFNLIVDTNKRLKEELDLVNAENSRLNDEVNKLSEEVSNFKSNLSASELRGETSTLENTFLRTEVKKLKEKIDNLYRQSDMADEWARFQAEINEAQAKMNTLNETISELRNNLSEANLKYENLSRDFETQKNASEAQKKQEVDKLRQEFEVQKSQVVSEQQKNYETLKADKTKREEMFKTLVNELKDVVSTVQKEFELKDVDWTGAKGSMADRVRVIKEEISQIKKLILDKIRNDREELAKRNKQIEESQVQSDLSGSLQKKLEECELKVKEKETKIGQMNNVIQNIRGRMQSYQKQNEDLTKELSDIKNNPQQGDQSSRIELDLLKNKLLQTQNDNEKLKKNLEASKQALADADTKLNTLTSSSSITSPITSQNTQETGASQQPPTAYIAPSRITNKPSQPPQQTVQNIASLRRTAAVQPTPHITQFNTEQWTQPQEQSDPDETRSVQPHESQSTAPSTSRDTDSGSVNKRTREEDNVEENSEQAPSTSNSKKQKNSNENVNEVFVAISSSQSDLQEQNSEFASSSQDQENQYILINDGEIQESEVQELENNEEIVVDDDTAGSDGYEDVIITSSGNQAEENQSSNGSNYNQDDTSNQQILDEGNTMDEEPQNSNPESNDVEEIEENLNQEENSGEIHLEIQPEDDNHEEESDSQTAKSEFQEEQERKQSEENQTETNQGERQTNMVPSLKPTTSNASQLNLVKPSTSGTATLGSPKPIVWDGPSSTSTTTTVITNSSQTQAFGQTSLKIRRTPVASTNQFQQSQPPFQQEQPVPNNPSNYRFVSNQYRINNSQFQHQNVSSSGQMVQAEQFSQPGSVQPQIISTQTRTGLRSQRTQQVQGQNPGRVLPQRGANQPNSTMIVRGGMARGGGNPNRGRNI